MIKITQITPCLESCSDVGRRREDHSKMIIWQGEHKSLEHQEYELEGVNVQIKDIHVLEYKVRAYLRCKLHIFTSVLVSSVELFWISPDDLGASAGSSSSGCQNKSRIYKFSAKYNSVGSAAILLNFNKALYVRLGWPDFYIWISLLGCLFAAEILSKQLHQEFNGYLNRQSHLEMMELICWLENQEKYQLLWLIMCWGFCITLEGDENQETKEELHACTRNWSICSGIFSSTADVTVFD